MSTLADLIERERVQFERWARSVGCTDTYLRKDKTGEYWGVARMVFDGWCAKAKQAQESGNGT